MYCQNCGKQIDDKAEICIGCGVRVKKSGSKKRPGEAALLSFLILGLGQIYSGRYARGILLFLSYTILIQAVFLQEIMNNIIGLIILIPLWIWNIKDANRCAQEANEE